MKVVLSRLQLATLALIFCVAPWLRGGKDPAGLMVIFAGALLATILAWKLIEDKVLRLSAIAGWGLLLLVWAMISYGWSVNRYSTVIAVLQLALAGVVGVVAYLLARTGDGRARFFRGYLELATLFSLYGFWLYVTGSYDRMTSTFYWANPWASFLLPVVIIATWRFMQSGGKWYFGIAVLNLAAFFLSFSRAADAVLVVAVAALLAVTRPKRNVLLRGAGVVVLALILTFATMQVRQRVFRQELLSVGSRFTEAAKGESTSQLDRVYYLRSLGQIFVHHPIGGTGIGTFGTVHPQYQYRVISASTDAHNAYLQLAAELGIVGLIAVIGLMVTVVLGLIRRARHQPGLIAPVIGTLALLAHLGLDIGASFPALLMLAAALVGVLYEAPKHKHATKVHAYWFVAAVLALSFQPLLAAYRSQILAQTASLTQEDNSFASAAEWYNQAHLQLTYNPDTLTGDGINHYTLARLGNNVKQNLDTAQRRAEAAIHQDPQDSQQYFLLARIQWAQGNTAAAIANYERAIALDPWNHPGYYDDLAGLQIVLQQPDGALNSTERGINLYSQAVLNARSQDDSLLRSVSNLHITRARALAMKGDKSAAAIEIQEAIRVDPTNSQATMTKQNLQLP
jgi:O-antigen ligase/Flp pilus assembly protein TadD